MRATLAILAVLLQLSPSPSGKGTIEGTVIRTGSGEPVPGIRVLLQRPPDPRTPAPVGQPARAPAADPVVTTDGQGRFTLRNLEAGAYRIVFSGNGYVRQEYGQKVFPGQGTSVEIAAGQTLRDIVMRLTPTASLSGRIQDPQSQPAPAVAVHLMRFTYDSNGSRTLQPAASTQTDDRGQYRFYFITPGRYYLAAGALRAAMAPRPSNSAMESYPATYFPAAADPGQATPIEIRAGSEMNMDLALIAQKARRIRGRVVDGKTGQPPSSIRVSLTYRGASDAGSYEVTGSSLIYSSNDGTFELRDVLPGSYVMSTTWGDSISIPNSLLGTTAPLTPQQANDPEARLAQRDRTTSAMNEINAAVSYTTLDVVAEDIENLQLTIAPGASISGRIRVDGIDAASTSGLERVKVGLKPSLNGVLANIANVYAPRIDAVAADGTFKGPNVKLGEYRLAVTDVQPGFYVKEAHVGPTDVLNRPFQFTEAASIEIVLSPGTGTVSGMVTNDRLDVVPGIAVVLVPDLQRDRLDLFKTTTADARGAFTFDKVAPGDYRAFAWEALEPYGYFDLALLKQWETRGQPVHLEKASRQTIAVKVIPETSR